MAGDWLKVEIATPDKPEIWAIADDLGIDPDAAFGKVFRVWAWFDQHSEKGNAPNVTKALLNRKVGVSGFVEAMINHGWLIDIMGEIVMSNHEKHNGNSSKQRANTAKRVAKHKAKQSFNEGNDSGNGEVTPAPLPKEEKRREENNKNKPLSKRFKPPTLDQVTDYKSERGDKGKDIDPEQFINHYAAKGWMIGKNKMKDWKAAFRTWEARRKEESTANPERQNLLAEKKMYERKIQDVEAGNPDMLPVDSWRLKVDTITKQLGTNS